jgi:hypothetical protein
MIPSGFAGSLAYRYHVVGLFGLHSCVSNSRGKSATYVCTYPFGSISLENPGIHTEVILLLLAAFLQRNLHIR